MNFFCKRFLLICCFIVILGNVSAVANDLFFIESVAYKGLSWDLRGDHLSAERKGGKIFLNTENNHADRYIKIIPHATQPEFVFFQPQHSFLVADITMGVSTPGAELQLWDHGNKNTAQMFKMIPVSGLADTYFIQNASSGLYLTAHGKTKPITQENYQASDAQKWHFKKVDGATMAPPSSGYMYSLENVMSKKFIDIPGGAPNQERQYAKLQLWDMDDQPDRYVELFGVDNNYFIVHPLHSTEVWDVENGSTATGAAVRLWPQNNTPAQQFKFEYAGEPLTYYIKNRNSGKYIDASRSNVANNGCPINIYPLNNISRDAHNRDNQKWRLHIYDKWQLPPKDQAFYVKSAYINKYWDLGGDGAETNQNGKQLQIWDLDNGGDRKYKIIPSGYYSWVYLQVQNGNRHIDIKGGSTEEGASLHLWDPHGGNSQRFAVQFTSPTTFVLRTNNWKAADIRGGGSNDWKKNGADLIQYPVHFHANQQFQLLYADGPNKGKLYHFPELNEKLIFYTGYNLNKEQEKRLKGNNGRGYTYFPDVDGDLILAIYSGAKPTGGYGVRVQKVVEVGGKIEVYVEETSPKPGQIVTQAFTHPRTVVKVSTTNENIVIKNVNGGSYNYFLPITYTPGLYFIESVAYQGLFWDLRGVHFGAERKGGKIQLYSKDNGADRFIKIIPHETQPDFVWFQPQHSYLVADFADGTTVSGAELQLQEQTKYDSAQMFKLIEVIDEHNTYYIQNAKSGLYLTAHGKGQPITQEEYQASNQQKWHLNKTGGATMAPPSADYVYAMENVMARKFIDIPGAAPYQERNGAKLQLWGMDYFPDRYVELYLTGVDGYFNIHPLHSTEVWDVEGGQKANGTNLQLWSQNNTPAQQFKFEYAGEPMTYYIKDRNSGKYLDASRSNVGSDGCPIRIYPLSDIRQNEHNRDNQKWRLYMYKKWQMPSKDQKFYIKSAYIDKYWDLNGKFNKVDTYGLNFQMWDWDDYGDRKFRIIPSGFHSWVNLEVQMGNKPGVYGPYVDIESSSKKSSAALEINVYKQDSESQRFAVQFTSPTTFVLRTNNWKAADINGGSSNDWKKNGADLIQYPVHFHANQQFQLVYADGPNKGKVHHFEQLNFGPVKERSIANEEFSIRAERRDHDIKLTWTANMSDIRGFKIYRSNTIHGEKVLLNDQLISEYFYLDSTVEGTMPYYYYWIQAIRRDGKASVMSQPVSIMSTKTAYWISFLSPKNDNTSDKGIWRINSDGTELNLFKYVDEGSIEGLAYTTGGGRGAFTVKNSINYYSVYTMNSDGTNCNKVRFFDWDRDFATSSSMINVLNNFSYIVKDDMTFPTEEIPNRTGRLCRIDIFQGTNQWDHIGWFASVKSPVAFDIFGDEIYFIHKENTNYSLKKYRAENVSVIDSNTTNKTPVVSRDGEKIYYLDYHGNTRTAGIFALNNSQQTTYNYQSSKVSLTSPNQQCYSLALSADDRKIAYIAVENSVGYLYMMNVDGTGKTKLADHVSIDDAPAWLPNSTGIVYLKKAERGYTLCLYSFEHNLSFELAKTASAEFEVIRMLSVQ
ncbi:MAG: RICIN domain-containing protein [Halanaerobiales bacterium]|nr:RICIN domain-containing protein [Halanaerobiales bacterium]